MAQASGRSCSARQVGGVQCDRCQSGFSLVEMLVVIAILLILAGILLPVLERALRKGEDVSCLSNIRNLALGARIYADDYDGQIIPARLDDAAGSAGICWDVSIQPYVRNRQLLICPSDETPAAAAGCISYPHSYGINFALAFVGGYNASSLRLYEVEAPTRTILFFELDGRYRSFGADYDADGLERFAVNRHGEGANCAFLDGHAKWLRPEATVEPENLWRP